MRIVNPNFSFISPLDATPANSSTAFNRPLRATSTQSIELSFRTPKISTSNEASSSDFVEQRQSACAAASNLLSLCETHQPGVTSTTRGSPDDLDSQIRRNDTSDEIIRHPRTGARPVADQ